VITIPGVNWFVATTLCTASDRDKLDKHAVLWLVNVFEEAPPASATPPKDSWGKGAMGFDNDWQDHALAPQVGHQTSRPQYSLWRRQCDDAGYRRNIRFHTSDKTWTLHSRDTGSVPA